MGKLKIMISTLKNFVNHLKSRLENVSMEIIETETRRKKTIGEKHQNNLWDNINQFIM